MRDRKPGRVNPAAIEVPKFARVAAHPEVIPGQSPVRGRVALKDAIRAPDLLERGFRIVSRLPTNRSEP
jgi:hypothetical protein